jgi:predicted 2-oxoglutarate/Fe(II)-dependent dioxygenase YbiX
VLTGIVSRCVPEIARAFHVDIAHTDRILLARYDETGGYFRRHRDNSAPSVAFRQFALSLNLNDDYDGGHVLFPEYNDRRYRPPAGAGVVFSCSLLHEAAPVTRGKRYCALTFLHDAAAQARWMGMSRRAS